MLEQLTLTPSLRCAWCELPTNPIDMQVVDIHDEAHPELITDVALVCNVCLDALNACVYHDGREGIHQCPKCKKHYCDECRGLFLPIDPMFWVETAMMCPQCHYETWGR